MNSIQGQESGLTPLTQGLCFVFLHSISRGKELRLEPPTSAFELCVGLLACVYLTPSPGRITPECDSTFSVHLIHSGLCSPRCFRPVPHIRNTYYIRANVMLCLSELPVARLSHTLGN